MTCLRRLSLRCCECCRSESLNVSGAISQSPWMCAWWPPHNRDLKAAVSAGTFREDLFYRLNVFPIQIPSLRDRVDDIPMLVEYLIERYAKKAGKKIRHIKKKTLELFQRYDWPGNIRELQNVIERAVILCDGEEFAVDESWLKPDSTSAQPSRQTHPRASWPRASAHLPSVKKR